MRNNPVGVLCVRKIRAVLLLGLVPSMPTVVERNEYYDVAGSSDDELRAAINTRRPKTVTACSMATREARRHSHLRPSSKLDKRPGSA